VWLNGREVDQGVMERTVMCARSRTETAEEVSPGARERSGARREPRVRRAPAWPARHLPEAALGGSLPPPAREVSAESEGHICVLLADAEKRVAPELRFAKSIEQPIDDPVVVMQH
jgi:hypothetical protein